MPAAPRSWAEREAAGSEAEGSAVADSAVAGWAAAGWEAGLAVEDSEAVEPEAEGSVEAVEEKAEAAAVRL